MTNGLILQSHDDFTQNYDPADQADLIRRLAPVAAPVGPGLALANLSILREAEVIFSGESTFSPEHLSFAHAPRLRAIFHAGGSSRNLVDDEFWARGILLSSPSAMNSAAIADYAVGAILTGLKHGFRHALHAHRHGYHSKERIAPGTFESTIGIIALGAVGRALLRRLRAFDLRVIVHDPSVSAQAAAELAVEQVGLEEIFARSDVVFLHAATSPGAFAPLIQGRHFSAMKRGAVFIDTGGGSLVREQEMIAELMRRADLTAVLDVTDPEPPRLGSPLYSMPNVILTPHIAGALGRRRRHLGRCLIEEFDRWQRREPLRWEITRERAAHLA